MLQKIIGVIGVLAVVGTIVMVSLMPKKQGFFPNMFDFLKCAPVVEVVETPQSQPVIAPAADTVFVEILPQSDSIFSQ